MKSMARKLFSPCRVVSASVCNTMCDRAVFSNLSFTEGSLACVSGLHTGKEKKCSAWTVFLYCQFLDKYPMTIGRGYVEFFMVY